MKLYSNDPFDLVCPFDPATDMTLDEANVYAELREWSLLKFHPNQQPTVYTIKRISQSIATLIRSTSRDEVQENNFAFMAGVVRVTNLNGLDGNHYPAWVPEWIMKMDSSTQSMTVAERELFPMDEAQDIGSVVLGRADLRLGRPVCFVPPHSSGQGWGKKNRAYLRAAESVLPSKKHSEPEEQPSQNT